MGVQTPDHVYEGLPQIAVPEFIVYDNDDLEVLKTQSEHLPLDLGTSLTITSGLSAYKQTKAKQRVLRGALQLLSNPWQVHYTQGTNRWSPMTKHLHIGSDVLPFYGDCSSTTTWLLKDSLNAQGFTRDIVNGYSWAAGYTGTQILHGKRIWLKRNLRIGDLIFYGKPRVKHVAIYVGNGYVFSHGSEGGPYKLKIDYRSDRVQMRRYI